MKLSVKEMVLFSMLTTVLLVAQVALSSIPNVEIVSLLVILYTLLLKKKTLYIIYIFAILEGLLYGFGLWWLMYLYVWTVLWGITMLFQKEKSSITWAFISGFFGLFFGSLCSVPYFIIGGLSMGFSYIASGLIFDIMHGISNFLVTLVLFPYLYKVIKRLTSHFLINKS